MSRTVRRPTIATPPAYQSHHRYRVVIGHHHESVRASGKGRLPIVVPLGSTVHRKQVRILASETLTP